MDALDAKNQEDVWQILTIDPCSSVNTMTKKSLEHSLFLGRRITVLQATSLEQAKQLLQERSDIAVVLLDIMADTQSESLFFIHFIRTVLKNYRTRIILRTGYPDTLPDIKLIESYEIDGYLPKESMPVVQIKITIMTAIRAYAQIITTERALQGLAGSIAHEMRNVLAQVKFSLDSIGQELQVASTQTLKADPLHTVYKHIGQAHTSIKRGLQITSITLNQCNNKAIDADSFEYLDAGKTTKKAVDEFCFDTESERDKVKLQIQETFTFKVNETVYLFILFNLIKNALYYFKLHPQATLTITVDRNSIRIKDTGPGIAPEMLSRLFGVFTSSGKAEGTGLGLAYCKRAMQAFGGDITCDSVLNQYTEFTLSFPVIAQAQLQAHELKIMHRAKQVFNGKHILIVDDEPLIRKSVRHMLDGLGAHFEEAENGHFAIDKLKTALYDLIIMDLNMPSLDGYAAAEMIRLGIVPSQKHIPIVAYTSESAYITQVKTEKIGMNGYVCKPATPLELIKVLQIALEPGKKYTEAKPTLNPPPTALAGKTVVVADDCEQNRKIIQTYLGLWGAIALEAEHGMAVLEILQEEKIVDAILMDMEMPGMSGVQTTQVIRAQNHQQHIPIIALTANFSEQHRHQALLAGMNAFISKPVESAELHAQLLGVLKEKRVKTSLQNLQLQASPLTASPAAKQNVFHLRPAFATPENTDEKTQREARLHTENTATAKEMTLLNTERLEQMKKINAALLMETLPVYVNEMGQHLIQLEGHMHSQDFEAMHNTLHKLLGQAGECGAYALHQFLCRKGIYPTVANKHQWPTEDNWLNTAKNLYAQTVIALRKSYLAAHR